MITMLVIRPGEMQRAEDILTSAFEKCAASRIEAFDRAPWLSIRLFCGFVVLSLVYAVSLQRFDIPPRRQRCADAVPLSRAVLSHIAHRRATVGDARTHHAHHDSSRRLEAADQLWARRPVFP